MFKNCTVVRLFGSPGHNIYDVRSQLPDWCTRVRGFFFYKKEKKRKKRGEKKRKSADFLGPTCVPGLASFQARRKQMSFSWVMQMFHLIWFWIIFFVCILLFLNICNTVMMTWCHVEMSAVLFLYVCVQVSKVIIKLKFSVYACVFIPNFCFLQLNTPSTPLLYFS